MAQSTDLVRYIRSGEEQGKMFSFVVSASLVHISDLLNLLSLCLMQLRAAAFAEGPEEFQSWQILKVSQL